MNACLAEDRLVHRQLLSFSLHAPKCSSSPYLACKQKRYKLSFVTFAGVSPQVIALNAIYGVEAWNFGSRTIKGRVGKNRTLDKTASQIKGEPAAAAVATENALATEAAAAVDLTDPPVASPIRRVPSKKGGPRKSGAGAKGAKKAGTVQICRDCQQVSRLMSALLQLDLGVTVPARKPL